MAYVKYYRLTAPVGEGRALRDAVDALLVRVRPLAGCQAVELLNDASNADAFVLLERWITVEAHKEGGRVLGKEAFAPVMAALGSPAETASLFTLD
jgi:quinol monooxygenase YgiN